MPPLTVNVPVTVRLLFIVTVLEPEPIVIVPAAPNRVAEVGVAKNEVAPEVASIDVRPASVVLVAPREIEVLPIVTELLAKLALVIPAVPDKFALVNPLIVLEPAAIVLLVRVPSGKY